MHEVKLIMMSGNETWFWVWNADTFMWEAFYEYGNTPAVRRPADDMNSVTHVTNAMTRYVHGLGVPGFDHS